MTASDPSPKSGGTLFVAGLVFLSFLGLAFLGLGIWGERRKMHEVRIEAGSPPTEVIEREGLVAYGWLQRKAVDDDQPLQLWVTVENHGDAITELRFVEFQLEGFERAACWSTSDPRVANCRSDRLPVGNQGVELASHQTVTFEASVKSTGVAGWFGFSGLMTWKNKDGTTLQLGIPIGPVQVGDPGGSWGQAIYTVLKDSLLPAVLLVIGFLFQRRTELLKQREEKAANQRAEAERKAADERARAERMAADQRAAEERNQISGMSLALWLVIPMPPLQLYA